MASERTPLLSQVPTDYSATSVTLPDVEPLALKWNRLNVFAKKTKTQILHEVGGEARPGEVLAVMGASGAGKSTMLNALAGKLSKKECAIHGLISYSGSKLTADSVAFVYQDDLFSATLTVKEQIGFNTALKAPRMGHTERQATVEGLLKEMSLEKCKNGLVKFCSGGEKKRLSIACAILGRPSVVLADEPTSGLDSASACRTIQALRRTAQRGATVICTIHQPNSDLFRLFDSLLLLAEGGRVAFHGPIGDSIAFFASSGHPVPHTFNPPDHMIRTLAVEPNNEQESKNLIKHICDAYRLSTDDSGPSTDSVVTPLSHALSTRWSRQFHCVFSRSFKETYRNPNSHIIRFMHKLFAALFFIFLYRHIDFENPDQATVMNVRGLIVMYILECSFNPLYSMLRAFPEELELYRREISEGMYSPSALFFGKVLAQIPALALDTLIVSSLIYWLTELHTLSPLPGFAVFLSVGQLAALNSASFGIMFSLVFEDAKNISTSIGIATSILAAFGGFYRSIPSLPVYLYWVKFLDWFCYAHEVLSVHTWSQVGHISCSGSAGKTTTVCFDSGAAVMRMLGVKEPDSFWPNYGFFAINTVVLNVIAFALLRRRIRK